LERRRRVGGDLAEAVRVFLAGDVPALGEPESVIFHRGRRTVARRSAGASDERAYCRRSAARLALPTVHPRRSATCAQLAPPLRRWRTLEGSGALGPGARPMMVPAAFARR